MNYGDSTCAVGQRRLMSALGDVIEAIGFAAGPGGSGGTSPGCATRGAQRVRRRGKPLARRRWGPCRVLSRWRGSGARGVRCRVRA
jgi:hypothetical protein